MPSHVPVMLPEVLRLLAPRSGGVYLDGTFGGGGHAQAILEAASCTLWAIDRDPDAIARGASLVARYTGRLHLVHGRFVNMRDLLADRGVRRSTAWCSMSACRPPAGRCGPRVFVRGDGPLTCAWNAPARPRPTW